MKLYLRVECILGLSQTRSDSSGGVVKEGANQYINRQSMNARLILVEKKVEQIGELILTYY